MNCSPRAANAENGSEGFSALILLCEKKESEIKGEQYGQVLAVQSSTNHVYAAAAANALQHAHEEALIGQLQEAQDTRIDKIVCVWSDGCIDLPSDAFRKQLCALNDANGQARILLKQKDTWGYKTIEQTR